MKMTLMQFVPVPDENLTTFMHLHRGETFRYSNGDRVYMVLRSGSYHGQAVQLATGETYEFDSGKAVRRVEVIAQWKTVGPN